MKLIPVLLFLFILSLNNQGIQASPNNGSRTINFSMRREISTLYHNLKGEKDDLSYELFTIGYQGHRKLLSENRISKKNILTLIDFTRPSKEKRLWVIDLDKDVVLYHELVAHGKNSGVQYANKFSNIPGTNMSSLGFYLTGSTYAGKHGLSLRLDGMEEHFNNNARRRAIVMHPAAYVSEDFIEHYGRIGRSFGCPSLPEEVSSGIINTIKDGSCLFIYYPDKKYMSASAFIDPVPERYLGSAK